jgi:hypothetical protein
VKIFIAYQDKHADKVDKSGEIDFIQRHFILKLVTYSRQATQGLKSVFGKLTDLHQQTWPARQTKVSAQLNSIRTVDHSGHAVLRHELPFPLEGWNSGVESHSRQGCLYIPYL